MAVRFRRILLVGSSYMVALPPDWLRGHGLVKGAEVEIRYGDGDLIVRPREAR